MPAQDSVQKIVEFVSPQGVPYKILKTKEIDAYDVPQKARKKRIEPRGP
jgi:NAD(P)H-dependent flavin oxidoreductase YrpB (nitropropane dioxygenase family)